MKLRNTIYIPILIGMIISTTANAQLIQHDVPVKLASNSKLQGHFYLNNVGMITGSVEYEPIVHSRPARVAALVNDTTIHLSAGQLSGILTNSQKATITNLQLTGSIDARDFKTMRDSMPVLSEIDIGAVSVSAYIGSQGTAGSENITYPADCIPQSAFSLGNNTFNFNLTSIILPTSITSIGDSAFYKCASLTGNLAIPGLVTSIGNNAYESCGSLDGTLILPNSLTTMGVKAFYLCHNLTGLTISESLTSISESAFDGDWSLGGYLTIPASVISIGDNAFYYCNFTGITIPNSVTAIGAGAFAKCKTLTGNVTIPSSITSISNYTFAFCTRLTSVTLPNSVTSIGENAFALSGLTSITLPDSIITIDDWAFSLTNLTGGIAIPNSLAKIGHGAFSLTGINEFMVKNDSPNFSAVDGVLFNKSKYNLIAYIPNKHGIYTIPDFVTSIGNYAFDYCNGLTAVTIPSSVVLIGIGAFNYCPGLTTITVNSATPIALIDSLSVFGQATETCMLYVPAGSKTLYQSANQWKDFINIVELLPSDIRTELVGTKQLVLYPNPVSDGFYIHSGTDEWSTVSIYNSGGMQLFLSEVKDKSYIDVANLPRGLYIVKISAPNGISEMKFLKN